MSTNSKFVLYVVVPVIVGLTFTVVGAINEWSKFWLFAPAIALGCIGWTAFVLSYNNSVDEHGDEVGYDEKNSQLVITARNAFVGSAVKIKAEMNVSMNYNPAEISYTGVSIGNVHTGSFNYHEESTSLSGNKTGTYYLNFGGDDYAPVYSIALTEELAKEEKKLSFISRYLVGNVLVLRGTGRVMTDEEKSAASYSASQGNLKSATTAVNIIMQGSARSELSHRDCADIKDWLSGKF